MSTMHNEPKGEIPFFYGKIQGMKDTDKKIYIKLYIIIGLCALISIALFTLSLSGGITTIHETLSHTKEPVVTTPHSTKEPSETPVSTPEPSSTPEPTPSQITDTTSDDSLLRIVNHEQPIGSDYVPSDLVEVSVASEGTQYLRKEAAESLPAMFADAEKAGFSLLVISGYRSYAVEVENEKEFIEAYGEAYASKVDCHPGASEHQLGLLVDLGTRDGYCRLDTCFSDTGASNWLKENAWKYGWIERHPEGKEAVTGTMYSPWNYRYVGKPFAKQLYESGQTMEEYFQVSQQP